VSFHKYVDCSNGKERKWKLHIRNTGDDHTETTELWTHIWSANLIKLFLLGWGHFWEDCSYYCRGFGCSGKWDGATVWLVPYVLKAVCSFKICEVSEVKWQKWSEVSYGEVLVDKDAKYIKVTLHCGHLITSWLFHLGISCVVFVLICTVVVLHCFVMCGCVCVGFVMCVFVWVL